MIESTYKSGNLFPNINGSQNDSGNNCFEEFRIEFIIEIHDYFIGEIRERKICRCIGEYVTLNFFVSLVFL